MRRLAERERKPAIQTDSSTVQGGVTVDSLLDKALQNEQILKRYQQFELLLLDLAHFDDFLKLLLLDSLQYFQLDCVELWLYDPQRIVDDLISEDWQNNASFRLLRNRKILSQLYEGEPKVRLVSTSQYKVLPVFKDREVRSVAMLPLVRHGVLVGSLHLGAKGHQRFSREKSTDFISHLASIVAACLENTVNRERLHRLSLYDMLTQVKNRRAFHLALDEEVSRASRSGDALSLLFVDLDYFKKVNDTYGHPMGDKVLKTVAQTIDEMLRKTDHVCRYGGEEFALILPYCDRQLAMEIAERIRLQICGLAIENDSDVARLGSKVKITLSIGICCWSPPECNSSEQDVANLLIKCSDLGVYQSKSAGRNCTHCVDMRDYLLKLSHTD